MKYPRALEILTATTNTSKMVMTSGPYLVNLTNVSKTWKKTKRKARNNVKATI